MLLFDYPDGKPMTDVLVMTSGNPSGAPISMDDLEAAEFLSDLSDGIFLMEGKSGSGQMTQ